MRAPRVGCQGGGLSTWDARSWETWIKTALSIAKLLYVSSFFLELIRNLRVGYQRTLDKGVKPRQIVHSESRTSGFTPFFDENSQIFTNSKLRIEIL